MGEDTNTSFTDDQYDRAYPSGIEYHWWNRARTRFISGLVRFENSKNSVFLEVGCGRGLVVQSLRKQGISTYGVELAPVAPLPGIEKCVVTGTDALSLPAHLRRRVSGILLLDVIEHLPDPKAFLEELATAFPELSVVIVTVPACQELWSNYDEFYGHYRRYSSSDLKELCSTLGWRQDKVGYFFQLPYLPVRLMARLGINRSTTIKPPPRYMRWLHGLISYVARLEFLLFPRRIKGTSAFAVFRL